MNLNAAICYCKWAKILASVFIGVAITWIMTGITFRMYEFGDVDPGRGAVTQNIDKLGSRFLRAVYLDQGWSEAESLGSGTESRIQYKRSAHHKFIKNT